MLIEKVFSGQMVRAELAQRRGSRLSGGDGGTRLVRMVLQSRNTRQKEAIRAAFATAGRPLSHDEALRLAQAKVDGLSIATIYRNIHALVQEGWLNRVDVPGDTARYEVAGKGHHHHFQCNACGKMFDLQGCGLKPEPKLPSGFRSTGHEVFLYGLCSACG